MGLGGRAIGPGGGPIVKVRREGAGRLEGNAERSGVAAQIGLDHFQDAAQPDKVGGGLDGGQAQHAAGHGGDVE